MIEVNTIGVNRYAPADSAAINLYGYDYASDLTLTQLIQAVCIRSAAVYESQSVLKMNMMTSGSQTLADASAWLEQVAKGTADWPAARTFCIDKLGIPSASLPASTDAVNSSYDKRMQVAAAMQDKMSALAQSQQEDMIDLQTLVNRRDVAYSTSSGVVRTTGQSQMQDAGNFL